MRDLLTARKVATLRTPGRHADGGGLYLSVDKTGRRRWVFMTSRGGRQREFGLGGADDVSLVEAREKADIYRREILAGRDPRQVSAPPVEIPSFGSFADQLVAEIRAGFRNEKHAAQWATTIKTYAAPIRAIPVDAVTTADILEVLRPIWTTKSETASRLRGRIERVLDAAKAQGLRSAENPARWRGHLDQLLPRRQRLQRGHHAALPYRQIPTFVRALRSRQGTAARALEFLILTAARSGEVRGATWSEVDLEAGVWAVPSERMKAGREHRVPLSDRAIALLRAQGPKAEGLVFVGADGVRPLSVMALDMLMRRMKSNVTVHGFRSSFRDWTAEATGAPNEVCEAALAHVIQNRAEAAYRRGDLFEKRRALMASWAEFIESAPTT